MSKQMTPQEELQAMREVLANPEARASMDDNMRIMLEERIKNFAQQVGESAETAPAAMVAQVDTSPEYNDRNAVDPMDAKLDRLADKVGDALGLEIDRDGLKTMMENKAAFAEADPEKWKVVQDTVRDFYIEENKGNPAIQSTFKSPGSGIRALAADIVVFEAMENILDPGAVKPEMDASPVYEQGAEVPVIPTGEEAQAVMETAADYMGGKEYGWTPEKTAGFVADPANQERYPLACETAGACVALAAVKVTGSEIGDGGYQEYASSVAREFEAFKQQQEDAFKQDMGYQPNPGMSRDNAFAEMGRSMGNVPSPSFN